MIVTPHIISDLPETPSQTAGPYVHIGLIPKQAGFEIFENNFTGDIAAPGVEGERIMIEGRIFDGAGHITKDVLVETWQANAAGRYNHPADRQDKPLDRRFRGWARTGTDFETGVYTIRTIKPGSVAGRKGRKTMAPHVNFWLAVARHQHRPGHAHVFRRRSRRQCAGSGAQHHRAARAPQDIDRREIRARRQRSFTPSTFICRANARPCSSMSDIVAHRRADNREFGSKTDRITPTTGAAHDDG